MNPRQNPAVLLAVFLAASWPACREEEKPRDHKEDLGLKIIPAGEKPARAPGPKGAMIEMDNQEVKILLVRPGDPADEAGFQAGDVLLAADGREITSEDELDAALESAKSKKIFFEVRRGRQIYTLPLATRDPGWIVLSGDTFKGFLLTRIQSNRKVEKKLPGQPAPVMNLPTFSGPRFDLKSLAGKPAALFFWGTFSEPCYAHMQALNKACESGLACVAVNTMELFTAVSKTAAYQQEMLRVRKNLWPSRPIPVDLFMESERTFGVDKIPTLILLDPQGKIQTRLDGPQTDPVAAYARAVEHVLGQ
jgi:cytochrome c biogenesis protein CcmG/thiol:disulfide interchange protein DsbE